MGDESSQNLINYIFSPKGVLHYYKLLRRDPVEYQKSLTFLNRELSGPEGFHPGNYDQVVRNMGPAINEEETAVVPWKRYLSEVIEAPKGETKWIVDGLLYGGGMSILSADPKCGKSTLMRWLITCLLGGQCWLGRNTTKGKVLYYCLEDPDLIVQEDFQSFSQGLELPLEIFEKSLIVSRLPPGQDPVKTLGDLIEKEEPVLVVVDTLMRFLRIMDDNAYGVVVESMGRLRDLMKTSRWSSKNCHLLMTHHNNKIGSGGQKDPYKSQMGSAAFRGATDVNLALIREGATRILCETEGKVKSPLPRMKIFLTERSIEHQPLTEGDDARSQLRVNIVNEMGEETFTKAGIKNLLKERGKAIRNKDMYEVINLMVEDQELILDGKKWRVNPDMLDQFIGEE